MSRKLLLIAITILLLQTLSFSQADDFFKRALSEPSKFGASKLISLKVELGAFSGPAVVENGDLLTYLKRHQGVTEANYEDYVLALLKEKKTLILNPEFKESSLFIPVKCSDLVNRELKKGFTHFKKRFFVDNLFDGEINARTGSFADMFAVAHVMFERGVITYMNDPTGLVAIY